ncbi:MAG: hypothetical protein K9I80_07755 [Ignavibacteriales bacterium]|nr:hypothetical protein [Ignavibacteriales bacterium]
MPADLKKVDFESLAIKQAPDNLGDFFKAEFRLPDDRHFFANWWGVLQLWKVQKAVEGIAGSTTLAEIEMDLMGSITEMYSYPGLVAKYIKCVPDEDVANKLKLLLSKKNEVYQTDIRHSSEIERENKKLHSELNKIDIQLNVLNETLSEKQSGVFSKLLSNLTVLPLTIKKKIESLEKQKYDIKSNIIQNQEYVELVNLIKKEKNTVYDARRKLNRKILTNLDEITAKKSFSTRNFSIDNTQKTLADKKPSIVFVDDQANDGWAAIFQRIIYGKTNDKFSVIQPGKNDSVNEISKLIANRIVEKKADLLVLDLRLKGERGNLPEVNEISGALVLKTLKEQRITCPILIMSASNKIWSYKKTLNLGASAYWIKEGLDDTTDVDYTIENYLRLIDLVYSLSCSEEFDFVYKSFFSRIKEIEHCENSYWWETKFWNKDEISIENKSGVTVTYIKNIVAKKENVLDILYAVFSNLEEFLKQKVQYNSTIILDHSYSSTVILQCCSILELIHKSDRNNEQLSLSTKMQSQIGEAVYSKYSKLINIRNSAVHNFSADFNSFIQFSELFINYLTSNIFNEIIPNSSTEDQISEPVHNQHYISRIESRDNQGRWYSLKNPNLNLGEGSETIILYVDRNQDLPTEKLNIGCRVSFKLFISRKEDGKVKYFANEAKIIEDGF